MNPSLFDTDATPEAELQEHHERVGQRIRMAFQAVRVVIGGIPQTRKAGKDARNALAEFLNADPKGVSSPSTLVWNSKSPPVKRFREAKRAVEAIFNDRTMTYRSPEVPGERVIRKDQIREFKTKIQAAIESFYEAANELAYCVDALRDEARIRRGNAFNEADYDAEDIRNIRVRISYPNYEPSENLAAISPEIYQEEIHRVREQFANLARHAQQETFETLHEAITHLNERLSGQDPQGNPKTFQSSTVQAVFDELSLLSSRFEQDGIGSAEVVRAADRLRLLFRDRTPDRTILDLRDPGTFRESVRQQCESVARVLEQQMELPGVRRIFL